MKKITVIFIVVFVLLSFVEICCLEEKEEIYRIKWGGNGKLKCTSGGK